MSAVHEKPASKRLPSGIDRIMPYVRSVAVVVCTIIAAAMFSCLSAAKLSMVYLAGIVISALYPGRGPSILATVLSVATFDFLFTEPYGTFAISDAEYVLTLVVMLLVALTISNPALRSKQQTEMARLRERHTRSLYAPNQDFANAQGMQPLIEIVAQSGERSRRARLLPHHRTGRWLSSER